MGCLFYPGIYLPALFEKLKDNTFYIYAGICVVGFLFVLFKVKETKGKTLEEVEVTMRGISTHKSFFCWRVFGYGVFFGV